MILSRFSACSRSGSAPGRISNERLGIQDIAKVVRRSPSPGPPPGFIPLRDAFRRDARLRGARFSSSDVSEECLAQLGNSSKKEHGMVSMAETESGISSLGISKDRAWAPMYSTLVWVDEVDIKKMKSKLRVRSSPLGDNVVIDAFSQDGAICFHPGGVSEDHNKEGVKMEMVFETKEEAKSGSSLLERFCCWCC